MKIKFDNDYDLSLSKPLKFLTMTIVVRSFFDDEGKFYPQIYLDQCLHDKIDISKGIGINKIAVSQECDICYYWYVVMKNFSYEAYLSWLNAMAVMIQCKKLWILMMLLLIFLKEVITEFTFGVWATMMQLV